jgi:predicted O-methyltransferase YrrM
MNSITRRDQILLVAVFLILSAGSLGLWIWSEAALLISVGILLALLIGLQMGAYRKLQEQLAKQSRKQSLEIRHVYQQIEALLSLHSLLPITRPLPPMKRNWAIAPDFAVVLVSSILENKPKIILEAGSGVSTLIAAYALKQIGAGSLVSLEHDEHFFGISSLNLRSHRLENIAKVVHAPLKQTAIHNQIWSWYDTTALKELKRPIDMLIVDGPPRNIHELARYPALPVLIELLSEDAVVFLDDANKEEVKQVVALWVKEFDRLECESIPTEKGTFVLRRKRSNREIPFSPSAVSHAG